MLRTILDDTRTITELYIGEIPAPVKRTVGGLIKAYREPGEMGYVTWFAVWKDRSSSEPDMRINAKYVSSVVYDSE